jgi:hypothetical protein
MRYWITSEEVQWEMKVWKQEWKVPLEPTKYKKPSEESPSKTKISLAANKRETTRRMKQTRGSVATRTLSQKKVIPKPVKQQKDHTNDTNGETHREYNIPVEEGQGWDIPEIDTPIKTKETYSRPLKRTVLQLGGVHNKMKVHKEVPRYTITKDDTNLVMKRV